MPYRDEARAGWQGQANVSFQAKLQRVGCSTGMLYWQGLALSWLGSRPGLALMTSGGLPSGGVTQDPRCLTQAALRLPPIAHDFLPDNKNSALGVLYSMKKESSIRRSRRALVIGINTYPYVDAQPLRGCVHDAERMATLLDDIFHFEVRLLLDEEATRDGILAALSRLLEEVDAEDRVVVHFSGHGSRVVADDGGTVETLVPHDSGRGIYPNRDLTDGEVRDWLSALWQATPYVTLVFDSCHAGGVTRDLEAPARGVEIDERPGCLFDKTVFEREAEAHRDSLAVDGLPVSERYTLLAACRSGERAREISDPVHERRHGVFTCFLAEELARLRGPSSFREVFERVALRVHSRFREQNPQLEGAWDREILGARDLIPVRFVPVLSRRRGGVVLGGGTIHDVVAGSEWRVYPPGTRQVSDVQAVGRLIVEETGTSRATARLIEEEPAGSVTEASRAVEDRRPVAFRHLTVRLATCTEGLTHLVDASPLLKRSEDDADVVVRQLQDAWIVTDLSGARVLPPCSESAAVVKGLERLGRRYALADLHHPHPEHVLKDVLNVDLHRRRPGDVWRPVETAPGSGPGYLEGDLLGIRIWHAFDAPLFVAVLDLGLAGSIEVLHPVRGAYEPLAPWKELPIGFGDDGWELVLPEGLTADGGAYEGGLETLLFLAAEDPIELDFFYENDRGATAAAIGDGSLGSVLRWALRGERQNGFREMRQTGLVSAHDAWTATSRSFWLGRG